MSQEGMKFLGVSWVYYEYLMLLVLGFFTLVAVLPSIGIAPPDDINFEYTARPPYVPLQGKLSPNNILDKAEKLYEGVLVGPESFVVHKNALYTGLITGEIIKFSNNKFSVVAQCGPGKYGGRAVGMRMAPKGDFLLVADILNGISEVNLQTGKVKVLSPVSVAVEGQVPRFPDDLDIDSDGIIYYSDATKYGLDFTTELFGEPTGRIIKYDPVKNTSSVLDKGLHFSNGVQLTPDHKAVLYCDMLRHRILKHHLKGKHAGNTDVFAVLPGGCDNIRLTSRGTYYVAIVSPLTKDHDKYIGEWPLLRRWLLRMTTLTKYAIDTVNVFYHTEYASNLSQTLLASHGIPKLIGPNPYSLLLELDTTGEVVKSYHSTTGRVGLMSEAAEFDGYLYFGGFLNNFLARVPLDQLTKQTKST